MDPCESFKPLLMGLLDGELTTEQLSEVNQHLNRCAACRHELEDLRSACDPLRHLSFIEPGEAQLERLWRSPFSRFTRWAGLGLVLLGILTLIGVVAVEVARDRSAGLPLKLGLAGIAVGFAVLLLSALRDRLVTLRHDPYREVER